MTIEPAFPNLPPLGPDYEDVIDVTWWVTISRPPTRIRIDMVEDGGYVLTAESYATGELVRFDRITGVDPTDLPTYRSKAIELIKSIMIEAWAAGEL